MASDGKYHASTAGTTEEQALKERDETTVISLFIGTRRVPLSTLGRV